MYEKYGDNPYNDEEFELENVRFTETPNKPFKVSGAAQFFPATRRLFESGEASDVDDSDLDGEDPNKDKDKPSS